MPRPSLPGSQADYARTVRKVSSVANLDLNLLVSLDALLQHKSVTKAAQQLGLSQPALSAALSRLRRHFNDDLLYRVGELVELVKPGTSQKADFTLPWSDRKSVV